MPFCHTFTNAINKQAPKNDKCKPFVLEDGSEVELVLPNEEKYFWLTEGQSGTLQYDGQRYVSFGNDGNGLAGFIREFREENARVKQRRGK